MKLNEELLFWRKHSSTGNSIVAQDEMKHSLLFSLSLPTAANPCLRMTCDFMCLLNPMGAKCTCPEGKVLVNGTCSDVNISGRPVVVYFMSSPKEFMVTGGWGVGGATAVELSWDYSIVITNKNW